MTEDNECEHDDAELTIHESEVLLGRVNTQEVEIEVAVLDCPDCSEHDAMIPEAIPWDTIDDARKEAELGQKTSLLTGGR